MRYKQTLPRDVKALVLAHVRGYDRRRRAIAGERDAVLGAPAGRGGRRSRAGSDTERRADALERIGNSRDAESVRAVETALFAVGADIRDEHIRERLRAGILLSCTRGREYPFERMDIPTVGRDEFYRRRHAFLLDVARELGYV